MTQTILKENVIQFRFGGIPFFFIGYFGYLRLTRESLMIKYYILSIPIGRFGISIGRLRVIGFFPRRLTVPLNRIQAVGKPAMDTLNTDMVVTYNLDSGKQKTLWIKLWDPMYMWQKGTHRLVPGWIQAIDLARKAGAFTIK